MPIKLAASLLSLSAASSANVVFSGSGNCDGADINCKAGPAEVFVYSQDSKGDLTKTSSLKLPGGGLPSWLRTSNDGKCLFATVTDGTQIASYSIKSSTFAASANTTIAAATLSLASTVGTGGFNPVYIDQSSDTMFVANYHGPDDGTNSTGAGLSAITIDAGCKLTLADFSPTAGRSVDPGRQGASHAHSVVVMPSTHAPSDASFPDMFVQDLGADLIRGYKYRGGKLSALGTYATVAGSGPRHMVIHPTLKLAYVLHEMGSYVATFKILPTSTDTNGAILEEVQRTSTRPGATVFDGYSKAAEIVITADASVLLASNRGFGKHSGTVAGFMLDKTGMISDAGVATNVGDTFPRGMELDTTDKTKNVLLVAGQSGGTLSRWEVSSDGGLKKIGTEVQGPAHPTTVAFATI